MDKLDHLGWVASKTYEVAGFTFAIRTTSAAYGEWLGETLSAYRTRKKADPYYSIVVADPAKRKDKAIKDFHMLYRGTTQMARDLNLATISQILLAEIEALGFQGRDDAVYAGAVPVAANGSVALAPIAMVNLLAGMGRQATRSGLSLPYVSAVALDPATGAVLPTEGPPGVPKNAIARLGELGLDGIPSDRMSIQKPLRPGLVLTMGRGVEGVEPVSDAKTVYTLASSVLNLEKVGITALETLDKVVSEADCYSVGGEARSLLRSVAGLLTPERP